MRSLLAASFIGAFAVVTASGQTAFRSTAQNRIQKAAQTEHFRGAVLIAKDGKAIVRVAAGLADEEKLAPNKANTVFEIASLTKQFTAAAILQLVDQKKLTLSDPVSKWIPDTPSAWQDITIHHLLTHTSGLPGNSPADFVRDINTSYSADELLATISGKPLLFKPGSQWRYSNSGYYALASIVEKLSGSSFAQYLEQSIFGPAKMKASGLAPTTAAIHGMSKGYSKSETGVRLRDSFDRSLELGAGGIHSTVDDLLRWNLALRRGSILSKESTQMMFTPHPPGTYGYGWFVEGTARKRIFHEGSDPGYAAYELRYPDQNLVIVVLSNYDESPVRKLAEDLGELWFASTR